MWFYLELRCGLSRVLKDVVFGRISEFFYLELRCGFLQCILFCLIEPESRSNVSC